MNWRSELTDEQRRVLHELVATLGYGKTVDAVRAAFSAREPRTREGWVERGAMEIVAPDISWEILPKRSGSTYTVRVLLIEIPADADAETVERVRRAAIEAMP